MSYTWVSNHLYVGVKVVDFQNPISSVKGCHGYLIVLLDPMAKTDYLNNVYAVDNSGQVVWRIQDVGGVYSIQNDDPYTVVREGDGETIVVTNFSGVRYVVDVHTGHIVGTSSSVK